MRTKYLTSFALFLMSFVLSSCGMKDKKTNMEIVDPERHYYPILRGQIMDIQYEIENTGNYPLFITDIHTSCGCVLIDESSFKVLPSGGKGFIRLKYDSNKNIGYVKHYMTIFANLESGNKKEITFDLHVVPNSLYTRDYEELYEDREGGFKKLVDGEEHNLRYYVDNMP